MITCGEGRYRVWLRSEEIGEDRLYILGGGETPHIGSMVLKEPGKEIQSMILEGHKDNLVMEPIAEKACDKYGKTTVVVGGIHIKDATEEEIDIIVKNCKELMRCI